MKVLIKNIPVLIVSFLVFAGCQQMEIHESHVIIKNAEWGRLDTVQGKFIIADSTVPYQLSIVLRHRDVYPYNNIWLQVGLQSPGDTLQFQKLNFTLGSDAGGWEGAGMNDIWEVRKKLNSVPQRFQKTGEYSYKIIQAMRDDPLKGVINVGLRVEKVP